MSGIGLLVSSLDLVTMSDKLTIFYFISFFNSDIYRLILCMWISVCISLEMRTLATFCCAHRVSHCMKFISYGFAMDLGLNQVQLLQFIQFTFYFEKNMIMSDKCSSLYRFHYNIMYRIYFWSSHGTTLIPLSSNIRVRFLSDSEKACSALFQFIRSKCLQQGTLKETCKTVLFDELYYSVIEPSQIWQVLI